MDSRINWGLLEISDDLGVLNVGGRIGAKWGPEAYFKILEKIKGEVQLTEHLSKHLKCAISPLETSVEINHSQVIDDLKKNFNFASRWIVVGGGHDHGYSHLKGIQEYYGNKVSIGCINLDAHLDVRPPLIKGKKKYITSGSPFYLAIENQVIHPSCFIEFGIQAHCNRPELFKYVAEKSIKVRTLEELRKSDAVDVFLQDLDYLTNKVDIIVLSLDLDCIAQAFAPGVSAPQSEGFYPDEIFSMLKIAHQNTKVKSLGIFELNPHYDINGITARLAATATYRFLVGS